jgi:hypothetical protein
MLLVNECTASAVTALMLMNTVHCMVTSATTVATTDIACAATLLVTTAATATAAITAAQTDLRALSQMKDEEDLIRDERNSRRPKQQSSRKGEVSAALMHPYRPNSKLPYTTASCTLVATVYS